MGPFPLSAFLDDLFLLEMQGKKVLNSYTFSLQKLSEREQREEGLSMLSFLLSVLSQLSHSCCAVQVGGVRTSPRVLVYPVDTELEMDLALWVDGNWCEVAYSAHLPPLSSIT